MHEKHLQEDRRPRILALTGRLDVEAGVLTRGFVGGQELVATTNPYFFAFAIQKRNNGIALRSLRRLGALCGQNL
jgi:hypothetical protein